MRTAFSTDGAPTLSPTPRRAPSALSASQAAHRAALFTRLGGVFWMWRWTEIDGTLGLDLTPEATRSGSGYASLHA